MLRRCFCAGLSAGLVSRVAAQALESPPWAKAMEGLRQQHGLPALAAAMVNAQGAQAMAVCGLRKQGATPAVSLEDLWHLGSNTKAMTATLAALAVQEGLLRWDSSLGEVFARETRRHQSPLAKASLTQLLSHGSGLPANAPWGLLNAAGEGQLRAQRRAALELALRQTALPAPGSRHEYSNWGYVLAGHMLEEVWQSSWEDLMRRRLFAPLGMVQGGFGGVGSEGRLDQPWPHAASGEPMPINGPKMDNPALLGPAGTVHLCLADWARFIAEHLAGRAGHGTLLKTKAAYEKLHQPAQEGSPHALGWLSVPRRWGGQVLNHNGSNTMNHSVAWLAPERGFAVIACTNSGSPKAAKALDELVGLLIAGRAKS